MTKSESLVNKGVAIVLMVFLHLFNRMQNIDLCHPLIYIDNLPLVWILTRACNPVPFFLILGGYGLYKTWLNGDSNRWGRILKIYIHWWLILGVFVLLSQFFSGEPFNVDGLVLIENALGILYSYNAEMWFLLPYVILSALSPFIFKIMNKCKPVFVVLITLLIHLATSFTISRYGAQYLYSHTLIYHLLLPFHLLFSFSLGAMAARTNFFDKFKVKFKNKRLITVISLLTLIGINLIFKYNFFYAFFFILFFNQLTLSSTITKILKKLGEHSMNIWMLHTWFCYYLFKDFIYSFSYPILIFLVLLSLSYICSIFINKVAVPVENLFISKKIVREPPLI